MLVKGMIHVKGGCGVHSTEYFGVIFLSFYLFISVSSLALTNI
jgi:hypothetical protein